MSDFNVKNDKQIVSKNNIFNVESNGNVDTKVPEEKNSLEDVLSELKLSGRYHIRFLILMAIVVICNAGYPINFIFTAEEVGYGCKYANCTYAELLEVKNSSINYKCIKYELLDENGTCTADNFDMFTFTACSEWVYEEPDSFVAEFNLGCEEWKRTLVGTMHSTGFMIGLLFIGPLSDKFGRKKIIIISMILAGVFGIAKSLVKSYWIFITLELLEPLFGDNYSTAYTMVAEMMTTKERPAMIILCTLSNTIGSLFITILAYITPNWRIYLISMYTPALLFILYIFYLDESPRWLLIKGRKAEADAIIRKAAKMNNIVIDDYKIANMRCVETSKFTLREAIKLTFSSKKLFLRLLLCCCIWFTSLYNAYSLLINSVSLEGNKYLNFVLVSLSDVAGGLISSFALTKFKRKTPLIIALTLTGVFCVSQSFVPKGHRWLAVLLYICGKINSSITLETTYLYTTELFPTYTRNTMLSICSAFGRIGSILAPLTPLLIVYWSGLPLLLVGVLSLMTATIVTLMPETSEYELPDNVNEAEVLGIKEKIDILVPSRF